MKRSDFTPLMEKFFDDCKEINRSKGNDYAGQEDAFRNFKEVAERTGGDAFSVWLTYFSKHVMAVETFIRDGKVESEPIEERLKDIAVYSVLLAGMVHAGRENTRKYLAKKKNRKG